MPRYYSFVTKFATGASGAGQLMPPTDPLRNHQPEISVMSDRQRRLVGMLLLIVGIGVASSQALLTSCSGTAAAASIPVGQR
ncbi:MAG: hypothetical protein K9L88_09245 [Chromatiaceae bacterium]|nr:hypothetical protein [Chromatiaceae bacterium]